MSDNEKRRKYHDAHNKMYSYLDELNRIKAILIIIKALFSRSTKIIATELDINDHDAHVGYIVSIDLENKFEVDKDVKSLFKTTYEPSY